MMADPRALAAGGRKAPRHEIAGRDAGRVHYRSDSVRGLFVGEQQALGLLRDYSRTTMSASMASS
jgi:hypothetical protein